MKETNKWGCALGYLVFFVPLLMDSENSAYRFHANQGLIVLLLFIAVSIVGTFIPVIGWFLILPFGTVLTVILFVIGVVNALNGQEKELPVVGRYRLIK
ncbi:hypothetical protein ACR6HW_17145 [Fusibacter sp. JL298sf-3]